MWLLHAKSYAHFFSALLDQATLLPMAAQSKERFLSYELARGVDRRMRK